MRVQTDCWLEAGQGETDQLILAKREPSMQVGLGWEMDELILGREMGQTGPHPVQVFLGVNTNREIQTDCRWKPAMGRRNSLSLQSASWAERWTSLSLEEGSARLYFSLSLRQRWVRLDLIPSWFSCGEYKVRGKGFLCHHNFFPSKSEKGNSQLKTFISIENRKAATCKGKGQTSRRCFSAVQARV